MPIYPGPICIFCKHFDKENKERNPISMKCKAFPNGIPIEIKTGRADHRFPYDEDKGFRFVPIENPDELPLNLRRDHTQESISRAIMYISRHIENGGIPE